VTLANGRSLHVRPVGPWDAGAEQAFVAGLSPVARFRRFHFGLNELPDALLRAFVNADQQGHVALVAEAVDDRRIVADARYVLDGGARTAEFAIAVSDAWQGLGLGRRLMHRLLARAQRSGIERLCGDVLADNAPMLALMKRLGARLMPAADDNSLYRVCLAL
jgi:acetyltransferase